MAWRGVLRRWPPRHRPAVRPPVPLPSRPVLRASRRLPALPTIRARPPHEYNWSITTARALSTQSLSLSLSHSRSALAWRCLPLTKALRVRFPPPLASRLTAHARSTYRWKGQKMPETTPTSVFDESLVFVRQTPEKSSKARRS